MGTWPAFAARPELEPRIPVDKGRYARLPEDVELVRVVVKFHEGTKVRLRGGSLRAESRDERERRDLAARGLTPEAVDGDLAEVQRLVARAPEALGLRRRFAVDESALAEQRAAGEERGGRQLADLDLYFELRLKPRTKAGDVTELLDALNALASVEIAYAEPPAEPASLGSPRLAANASVTPNFQSLQGYLNAAAQGGIDALYAWTQAGGAGQGIKIVDIEGAWRTTHEDLPALFHAGGTQINTLDWRNHGTAVLGEIVAKDNGLGMKGIAYQAQAGYESIGAQDLATALINASSAVGDGGVILIPMHWSGPANSSPCTCNQSQCDYVPAEYFAAHFDAIAQATANGRIVVELAGNGSSDLDDPVYGNIFQRSFRDSGAILVAASHSYDRNPTCWTNWGSRIDVHGWGEDVATLGYHDYYDGGSEDTWYTAWFSGTSAASPIVTGAATSIQGRVLATLSGKLDPLPLRDLLKSTGTPQAPGSKNIGPLPNLKGAFDFLAGNPPPVASFRVSCFAKSCSFDASASTDAHGISTYTWSFGDSSSSTFSWPSTSHYYSLAGTYTVTLTVRDVYGASASASREVHVTDEDHTQAAPESYVPVSPCRIFDTRSTDPLLAAGGILTSDQVRQLQLTGRCGIPSDARAVAVNVAAVTATARGNFQFYPGNLAGGLTATSSLNFGTANRANNAILRLATDGSGTLKLKPFVSSSGQVHMVMDVAGYFTESRTAAPGSAGPLGFQPLAPCRIADSRSSTPLAGDTVYPYAVQGACSVPSGAEAASLLVTGAQPSAGGNIAVYPNGIAVPGTSTINLQAGMPLLTNSAVAKLAATAPDVALRYSTAGATVHAIVDTNGYFKAGAPLRYRAVTPCRIVDTRSASQGAPVLAHGAVRTFPVQGNCGVPEGAKAAFLNLNAFSPTGAGSLTAFAGGSAQPSIPSLNFDAGELSISNGILVPLGAAGQDLALAAAVPSGSVHAIVDLFGYFETDPGPQAAFAFNCSGLACTFDASQSYDNFEVAGYHWDFGDGSVVDTASPTQGHTFAGQSVQTVTLTVSDAFGQTASKTWQVKVSSEAPQPAQSYFEVTPCRLLDTRSGGGGILTSGEVRSIQVTGACGIPASAKAVAVNVAAITATSRGNLQFYPGDQTGGLTATSNLNFGTANRANNAILRLGAGGSVKVNPFVASSGQVHLVIDVQGYFSDATEPGATALGYQPVKRCRLVSNQMIPGGTSTFSVQGAGSCGVPAGAAAAHFNTSVAFPTTSGNLLLYENGLSPVPGTSTINFPVGSQGLSNGSITALAPTVPDLAIKYSALPPNEVQLVLDVFGYFKAGAPLKYHPVQPCRAIDTRFDAQGGPAALDSQERGFVIRGNCGIPSGAKAVFAHAVVILPTGAGYLFAYSDLGSSGFRIVTVDGIEPTVGNSMILTLASSPAFEPDLILAMSSSPPMAAHVVVDLFGYFD